MVCDRRRRGLAQGEAIKPNSNRSKVGLAGSVSQKEKALAGGQVCLCEQGQSSPEEYGIEAENEHGSQLSEVHVVEAKHIGQIKKRLLEVVG